MYLIDAMYIWTLPPGKGVSQGLKMAIFLIEVGVAPPQVA